MPISAPMVTTPVPPTPVTRMPHGLSVAGSRGAGSGPKRSPLPAWARPWRRRPPSMVTKLGQKPFMHE